MRIRNGPPAKASIGALSGCRARTFPYIQEALRKAGRLETLLFALSSSDRLVRVLRTIIRTLIVNMFGRQAEGSKCSMIRS